MIVKIRATVIGMYSINQLYSPTIRNETKLAYAWFFVCVIYLSEGIVPTLWDAIFDIKTKQLRNSLGFNISVFKVYVSNG